MNMKRIYQISLIAVAILGLTFAFFTSNAHAQSPYELRAQVDANEITTDDTLTFTLTLTTPDGNAPRLNLPALDGFDVVGSSTSSQYSIVNGGASASMVYAYQLKPTRTGDLTIPAMKLNLKGQLLATEPLAVRVTQGNGAPSKRNAQPTSPFGPSPFSGLFGNDPFNDPFFSDPFSNDMFSNNASLNIQAATDKQSVYVGEPLEYSVRVSSDAMLLGEPEYDAPKFTGFWAHQPPQTRQGANASEITTLLFPTKGGQLTIDPATIRADGGFFSNALERQTDPVTIDVKPLPQGAPAEFNGAVGKFEITATPDKTETRVGEPIVVQVEIRGAGNFDTLADPKWVNNANWRAFDAKAETKSDVVNGTLQGTKTYTRTLIPTREGTLTIPATRYAYFDPRDEKYHTIETQAIQVQVAPGDPSVTQNIVPTNGASNANAPALGNAGTNAPALMPASAQLTSAAKPLAAQPLFWGLLVVPFGIVAFDIGLGLRKRYLDANIAERRASRALKQAYRNLKRAAKSKNVSMAVSGVVLQYLEDKLNRSLFGVSHSALAQLLAEHSISQNLIHDVLVLLLAGESSEFGKLYSATPERTVMDARLVLDALEGEWQE